MLQEAHPRVREEKLVRHHEKIMLREWKSNTSECGLTKMTAWSDVPSKEEIEVEGEEEEADGGRGTSMSYRGEEKSSRPMQSVELLALHPQRRRRPHLT